MSRWTPDAKRRLQDAALELFAEHGYEETTVAAVAAHAGLTERTFFRHFEDKKEVLFTQHVFVDLVAARTTSSTSTTALEMAADGFRAIAEDLHADPARVRRRAQVIAASPELQEREMRKFSEWTGAVRDALIAEQVEAQAAWIAAEVATALFRIAYLTWVGATEEQDLTTAYDAVIQAHRSVTTSVPYV